MIVLDSQALSLLANSGRDAERVIAYMDEARKQGRGTVAPTVVIAEAARGPARRSEVEALLSRERDGLQLVDTNRPLATLVGEILYVARATSTDIVDAHCVAAAVTGGGRAVVLTSDTSDIDRLAAPFPNVISRAV